MTVRWHRPAWEYEGYGTYEFDSPMAGYGQLPSGVSVEDIIANMDVYIITIGGIQVAKTEVQQPIMDTLDSMQFSPENGESDPTISGNATFVLFDLLGSDFASDYRKGGYAILADKTSVQSGTVRMLLTKVASVIAQNAGTGGNYVVVNIDPQLLAAAQAAVTKPPPKPNGPPPRKPGNGITVPSGCYLDMEERLVCPKPPAAKAGTPEWVMPAVVGVGALALVAAIVAARK